MKKGMTLNLCIDSSLYGIQEMILNVSTTNFETQCDCTFKYNHVIYLHFRLQKMGINSFRKEE